MGRPKKIKKVAEQEVETKQTESSPVEKPEYFIEKKQVAEQVPQPSASKSFTEGQKMWEEIKNRSISIFSLPEKMVEEVFKPVDLDPSKLFLIYSTGATLPALEESLGREYSVEVMNGKYIVITRAKR